MESGSVLGIKVCDPIWATFSEQACKAKSYGNLRYHVKEVSLNSEPFLSLAFVWFEP